MASSCPPRSCVLWAPGALSSSLAEAALLRRGAGSPLALSSSTELSLTPVVTDTLGALLSYCHLFLEGGRRGDHKDQEFWSLLAYANADVSQHLSCGPRAPGGAWNQCWGCCRHLPWAFIPSAGQPCGYSGVRSPRAAHPKAAPKTWLWAPQGHCGCPMYPALGWHSVVNPLWPWAGWAPKDWSILQQSSLLLLIPRHTGTGSCHAAGPLRSSKALLFHPDLAAFRCERDYSRDANSAGEGCSPGELLARFAIHGTNLSEIHFRRKKHF